MALPGDDRVTLLRLLSRRLEELPPSPERDALLARTRVRLVELEAGDELGPPSSFRTFLRRNRPDGTEALTAQQARPLRQGFGRTPVTFPYCGVHRRLLTPGVCELRWASAPSGVGASPKTSRPAGNVFKFTTMRLGSE